MTRKHRYTTPETNALEMKPSQMVLTSINTLAIDNAIGSIDEVTFDDFNQIF